MQRLAQDKSSRMGAEVSASLVVVEGAGASLLGRDLMAALGLQVQVVDQLSNSGSLKHRLDQLLEKHRQVFSEELGRCIGPDVSILVDESVDARFFQLGRFLMHGQTNWRRSCSDYKVTVLSSQYAIQSGLLRSCPCSRRMGL